MGGGAKDTHLVPLQRTLRRVSRRISGSTGTVRLGHHPIVQASGTGFRQEEKGERKRSLRNACIVVAVEVWARACAERVRPFGMTDDGSMMSNARWFSVSTRDLSSWSVWRRKEEGIFVGPLGTRPMSLSVSNG